MHFKEFNFNEVEAGKKAQLMAEVTTDEHTMRRIKAAIKLMQTANEMEEEVKGKANKCKAKAEDILAPLHLAYEIRGAVGDFGNLSFYYGNSSKFNKVKLQEELVKAKVKLQVITAAIKAATTTKVNEKLTVQLKKPKK